MANVTEKVPLEFDFVSLLKQVQESKLEGNLKQALKLASIGYHEALNSSQNAWTGVFISLLKELGDCRWDGANELNVMVVKESVDENDYEVEFEKNRKFEFKAEDLVKAQESEQEQEITDGIEVTEVKGVGESVARKMRAAGITSAEQLASKSVSELSELKGIGPLSAKKYIDSAKKLLDSFVETDEQSEKFLPINEIQDENIGENLEETLISRENKNFKLPEVEFQIEPISFEVESRGLDSHDMKLKFEPMVSITDEKNLEVVFDDLERKIKEQPVENSVVEDSSGLIDSVDSLDSGSSTNDCILDFLNDGPHETFTFQESLIEKQVSGPKLFTTHEDQIIKWTDKTSVKEGLKKEQYESNALKVFEEKIKSSLESREFAIAPKKILNKHYKNVDFIAVKLVKIKELLDVLLVIPIKICNLKGKLIVSKSDINYVPNDGSLKLEEFDKKLLYYSQVNQLKKIQETIFDDIVDKGELVDFFNHFLKMNLTVEKSSSVDRLFLRSGQLEYKIIVDPVLACVNDTGNREKITRFTYQEGSNLHFAKIEELSELLAFLEQKYYQVEKRLEDNHSVSIYQKSLDSFLGNLRLISTPLVVLGFFLALAMAFQAIDILMFLTNLGFGMTSVICIGASFFYYNFYSQKSALEKLYSTPYNEKTIKLKEADLLSIETETNPETLEQLIFECFGKKLDETKLAISESAGRKKEKLRFAKMQELRMLKKKEKTLVILEDAPVKIKSYSSFLED